MNHFWYRVAVWCWRYLRFRDLLQIGKLTIVLAGSVELFRSQPGYAAGIVVLYSSFFLLSARQTLKRRRARDHGLAETLRGLFAQMNTEIFNDDHRTRFTLFIEPPLRPGIIVPWYRYMKGATSVIAEAQKSRACYRPREGITGEAWASPRQPLLMCLPKFSNRQELERYYTRELAINPDVAASISDYMVDVQTVLSCGLTDTAGDVLGVLSLDIMAPLIIEGSTLRLDDLDLDANSMSVILHSIQIVLESFEAAEKT